MTSITSIFIDLSTDKRKGKRKTEKEKEKKGTETKYKFYLSGFLCNF